MTLAKLFEQEVISEWQLTTEMHSHLKIVLKARGLGRVVGALGSEAGFAGSMLNWFISMMHVGKVWDL